jgi:hypothetical protein
MGACVVDSGGHSVEGQGIGQDCISVTHSSSPERQKDSRATRVEPHAVLVLCVGSEL